MVRGKKGKLCGKNAYMILFDSYTSRMCCRGFLKSFQSKSEITVNYQRKFNYFKANICF
jgi:hypothetical protein